MSVRDSDLRVVLHYLGDSPTPKRPNLSKIFQQSRRVIQAREMAFKVEV